MKRKPYDFQRFQQQVFDDLDLMEGIEKQQAVERFVAAGKQADIDVVAEILDRGKTVKEVIDAIRQKGGLKAN